MVRKAKVQDGEYIYQFIGKEAEKGTILQRSLNNIFRSIRSFWVYEDKDRIVGVCSLEVIGWDDLGEIRSLVVDKRYRRGNVGRKLVEACLREAQELGIKKVFALTFVPEFFKKLGFKVIKRERLPHKIWSDCMNCIFFPNCKEKAVMIDVENKNKGVKHKEGRCCL